VRGRVLPIALAALAVIGGGAAWLLRPGDGEPAFSADLGRLRSVDDLYTAPQIRQQSGYALAATAFSRDVLHRLRQDPPALPPEIRRRLASPPDETPARTALARALLARLDAGVRAPATATLRAEWRKALAERDDASALGSLADLADANAPAGPVGRPPAPGGSKLAALLRRTARNADPAVIRARARVVHATGGRPDAAMRAVAGRPRLRATTTADRVLEAAAVLESAAATGARPAAPVVDALLDAASQMDDAEPVWVALRALQVAGRPTTPLAGRGPVIRRGLGSAGAVRELAIYTTIAKAVWLAAHLRLQAGAEALPDRDMVALSRVMARRDDMTENADDRALLFASARLAGLEYRDAALSRAPVPSAAISTTQQAITWAQRAQVATDLGARPAVVAVQPWKLDEDVDLAALGLVLAVARGIKTKVAMPEGTADAFAAATRTTQFRSSRWTLWAAAGLVATGHRTDAGALVGRGVRVGCPTFPHLVAEPDGTCDLESTWFMLRLADEDVPAAKRLAREITGEGS
jgi:hypothetical protein